jgi:tRNA pseudouridine38-40 synthase
MRRMLRIRIVKTQDRIVLAFRANAFLYHMVRNLVGALVAVGRGERSAEWGRELIEGRDRSKGAETAPAHGLALVGVAYPDEFGLAAARA